mmetsp:Transcript_60657/g.130200  ORF Transcript_60657/g.130200 Transcript_60657/m.130200 type:complete len:746 (-) Transcript_60657:27-2264(-)
MAPASVAGGAFALLEQLIRRHPHEEKLAKRLSGLHAFMPLVGLPWGGPGQPAHSHLDSTMALGSAVRRSVAALFRCTIDTEMGMRVAQDRNEACMESALNLLMSVLKDRDQPESLIAAIGVLGIISSNMSCLDKIPEDNLRAILEEFMRNDHKPSRNQLAKLLRHCYADENSRSKLQAVFNDESLGLNEEQQARVMQEVFDARTLAGQAKAEKMREAEEAQEQTPCDVTPEDQKSRKQAVALVAAIFEAYLKAKEAPRVLVMGRIARALCRCFGESHPTCRVVLGDITLERLNAAELGTGVVPVLLPVPQGVESDSELASQEHFDLVITGEPMGYYDVGEYAEKLKPFIKRRQKEDDKKMDQVQWLCIEFRERLEDARDELYSAGYYNADHDQGFAAVRKLALQMEHDVALLALPSYEKENRKKKDQNNAIERMQRRMNEEEAEERKQEENEQRRGVLYETLFDPLLSAPEASCLPVAFELGAAREEADLLLFWLNGNGEEPEGRRQQLEELLGAAEGKRLRIVVPTFPEGQTHWFKWSDEVSCNFGMEFYELHDMPTDEDIEKARKQPAKNISFGKPSFEEMQCLEALEVSCKQLLLLAEEEVEGGLRPEARIAFGGYSQGGSVGVYAAMSYTASEEVQSRICAVVPCCSGVPVLHFLAPKMQATCLEAKERGVHTQPIRVDMVYGRDDPQVKENFVETSRDLYKRFDYPTTVNRFGPTSEERFPVAVMGQHLPKVISALLKST